MKKILITLTFALLVTASFAQSITGDWYGSLNVQSTKLPIVFHITKGGDGYTTTMDSPAQGAKGLPTDQTVVSGSSITISSAKFGLKYTGIFKPDSDRITGTFAQGPGSFPLVLTHNQTTAAVAPAAPRPQDPKEYPYKREDVTFINPIAGDHLAGTLTMPTNGKPTKIVILITGSGPQNRDEELKPMNHRPFLVWSDWLTRQGIAVLRYDDRGIGESTGNFNEATSAGFADDAEAAVAYIQSRADLRGLSIGLMGHSEGGMIAPIVASRNPAVKFIVLLAGPGVPITELMLKQSEDQVRLAGAPPEAIKESVAINKKLYDMIAQNAVMPRKELVQKLDTVIVHELTGKAPEAKIKDVMGQVGMLTSPWYRYFMAFKPADYLTKVKCPVLAINGTKDMQVNCEANLAGIKTNLEKAGNKHFKTVPLADLNHLLQKANTGAVSEYSDISETVNPVALNTVSEWIGAL